MIESYLKLGIASAIPVLATVIGFLLGKTKRVRAMSYRARQLLCGLVFGAIAIVGTEWGIPLGDAVVNCRDAAPLCAGLFFGAPAGIIAGVIGGVERWFAVYWSVGAYTRIACSVSTVLAGLFAAALRKHRFASGLPRPLSAGAAALLIESFHMSMVFFTNLTDADRAARVVRAAAPSMLIANSASVFLACIALHLLTHQLKRDRELLTLTQIMQRAMSILSLFCFAMTTLFIVQVQDDSARRQALQSMQQGIADVRSSDGTLTAEQVVSHRHLGTSGFLLVVDKDGRILSAAEDTETTVIDLSPYQEDEPFSVVFSGENWLCLYDTEGQYAILAAMPESEVYSVRDVSVVAIVFDQILIYGLMFVLLFQLLKKTVIQPLEKVNGTLENIVAGDLSTQVRERSSQEFSELSGGINTTVDALKGYIENANAHLEKELQVARDIQLSALPRTFPAFPGRKDLDIYAFTQPAKEVGGDFYDFYVTADGHFHILIADVSGKGIPAAMFMMRAKAQLKGLTEAGGSIEEVFRKANNALCEGNDAEMFVTVWMADIDPDTGEMRYASAGHNPPALQHKGGKFAFIPGRPGFVMGGMEDMRYRSQSLKLEPGDRLVLYTDGVTEASNIRSKLYGDDRLLATLNARAYASVELLAEATRRDVMDFTGEAPQFDDITMLAYDFIGHEKDKEIAFDHAALDDIPAVTEFVEAELEKLDCPMKTVMQLDIAVDEIYSNIVHYAYPKKPGPASVRFSFRPETRTVVLTFTDDGIPYNPVLKEDPDTTLDAQERQIGGLGIFMVKKSMDDMTYEYTGGKNILHLFKVI